jgi:hypothetical protein
VESKELLKIGLDRSFATVIDLAEDEVVRGDS